MSEPTVAEALAEYRRWLRTAEMSFDYEMLTVLVEAAQLATTYQAALERIANKPVNELWTYHIVAQIAREALKEKQ